MQEGNQSQLQWEYHHEAGKDFGSRARVVEVGTLAPRASGRTASELTQFKNACNRSATHDELTKSHSITMTRYLRYTVAKGG